MNRDLIIALRHALESGPPTAEAHLRLGTALLEEGSAAAAEHELRAAVELDPGCAGAWVNLGGILFSRWDFAGALEANRRAAEAEPGLAVAHFNQGLAHLMSGAPAPSLDAFGRAIELDAGNGAAYFHLAVALHALGRTLEAEVCSAYARELDYRPTRASAEALERAALGARAGADPSCPQATPPTAATAAGGDRHGSAQRQ